MSHAGLGSRVTLYRRKGGTLCSLEAWCFPLTSDMIVDWFGRMGGDDSALTPLIVCVSPFDRSAQRAVNAP